ncbi:MAG: S9 family peptidase, partial [Burkholderiales bacterium]|nr:S9 family peptidase [Burkholderiales bacterium]
MRPQLKLGAALMLLAVSQLANAQEAKPQAVIAASPDDKFVWLEDVAGEKSLAWVKARNQVTRGKLDGDAGFNKLRDDLKVVLDSKDRIPGIRKMGKSYYNFWTDAEHPRGVWRKTSLEEYRKAQPKWETVLD